ncbi:MAG: DNA helicase RecQ [Pyramidobacter porci]|uniref:DNA helicase RecQ n=1 Tax=Pyramidobacter porci TaxID=2605789 RepID=UPI002A76239A|nr:DNA helicase RecQ [Pyramidobacter porci]MDY2648813.1 DNA helicase RecQ [Pyramidobacter porci]
MDEKLKILKQYFGYSSFRPGQEKTIDALLGGRDTFAVMPTGAGKSICYQIPALLGRGVSLVVSPLVSLMKDQVMSLVQMGVKAAYINSSLTPAQIRVVLDRACGGQYKIIYVAPERLLTGGFLQFAQNAPIDYVTVDEAHCVSKWGQDFRPSYLDVRTFVSGLPKRPVLGAFTATATAEVRKDVVDLLGLERPYKVVTGFDRKNLFYEVRRPTDRRAELLRIVKDFSGRSGIVYCATRKNVDEICEMLRDRNVPAARYHAGLDDAERSRSQDDFVNDRVGVMVATNAFGMGIDKSNVSYVVHYNMPGDMESYYQEAGRAGRDGEPAWCILLYGAQDVRTQLFFIERMGENSETAAGNLNELQELARLRLKGMIDYCFTSGCLRAYILKYFGEEPPARCDNCGNCQRVLEQVDVTIDAQKILSCVKRAHEAWGVKVIMDVLRGSKAAKLRENGLDGLTTYGIMADVSEQRLRDTIFYLTQEKYLASSGGQYPRLILGERAAEVLRDRKNITAPLPQIESRTVRGEKKKRMQAQMTSGSRPELYERLKALRFEIARAKGVPAFMVFTNAALTDMSEKMPRNIDEFLEISGVGERKAAEYGERFVAAIEDWLSEGRPSA